MNEMLRDYFFIVPSLYSLTPQQSLFVDRNLGDVACWALAFSKALSILVIVGAAIGWSRKFRQSSSKTISNTQRLHSSLELSIEHK